MLVRRKRHQPFSRGSDRRRRFFLRSVGPKADLFVVDGQCGFPSTHRLTPVNTSIFRGGHSPSRHVLAVLGTRNESQVLARAVQAISVNMIDFAFVSAVSVHHKAVQQNSVLNPINPLVTDCISTTVERPSPLVDALSVGFIHKSVRSYRAILGSERNVNSGAIMRMHLTLHRSGAVPRVVASNAGVYRVNYSTCLRVEAS